MAEYLQAPEYIPPPSFHFRVIFPELGTGDSDTMFQSVNGLSASIGTENVKEGGENRFTHSLPVRSAYEDLVLKRGVLIDSDVVRWCRDALEAFAYQPTTVLVELLNDKHEPLVTWNVIHAWPKKWSISDLDAEKSEVLVETLELTYNFFTVDHSE